MNKQTLEKLAHAAPTVATFLGVGIAGYMYIAGDILPPPAENQYNTSKVGIQSVSSIRDQNGDHFPELSVTYNNGTRKTLTSSMAGGKVTYRLE